MARWKPARGRKKPEVSRARQIGCIIWLALVMVLVMLLFYAIVKSG
jgi:hypothetical protein